MKVLKIATAGSVDDGKSTLIGRLLYDTNSLTEDKLEAIEKSSKSKGYDYLDFSLATDGLVAEREQGITIDVAHIYFSTATKSYIIADTPGHVEYTRNMVTGASTSQASIILVDARHGVIEQTYRHFFINNLLRVKDIIVTINKMDLVDYSQEKYEAIKKDFMELAEKSNYSQQNITFIPISALKGDNVVSKTDKMPWYDGQTVLEHLEVLESEDIYMKGKFRFPIQNVIRPKTEEYHDFRAYAGKVYGEDLAVGDKVVVLPSLKESKVKAINFFDKQFASAPHGSSISVELEHDINVSRGDMIVKYDELPKVEKQITATVTWMDSNELLVGKMYVLQHGVNRVLAKVSSLNYGVETDFSESKKDISSLGMNGIASVTFKLNKPIFADSFLENRANGSFILIDKNNNNTSGVGFIE